MREKISRKLLGYLERGGERHSEPAGSGLPAPLRCLAIQILLDTTARGFGVRSICLPLLDPEAALRKYMEFSRKCMRDVRPADGTASLGQHAQAFGTADRLYRSAYTLGARIRKISGLTDPSDLRRLVIALYGIIRIDMAGDLPGEITVTACYFSRFYTPAECAVMSFVDSGLIAGIFGGGHLRFTERITEGCGACRACFAAESA